MQENAIERQEQHYTDHNLETKINGGNLIPVGGQKWVT